MHPRCGDFREKKKCERVYLPGGGPAGPPHRPESLAVFKILAAPPYTPLLEAFLPTFWNPRSRARYTTFQRQRIAHALSP